MKLLAASKLTATGKEMARNKPQIAVRQDNHLSSLFKL
jgi:hypothetical protein